MKYHILVVDDDDKLRVLIGEFLKKHGFLISYSANTAECRVLINYFQFDLLLLDLMMPHETGVEFLKQNKLQIPSIMLSALGDVDDRITGLQSGADDYMAKPFEPRELILRINNILRREEKVSNAIKIGAKTFDRSRLVLLDQYNVEIPLTSLEGELLELFAKHCDVVLNRDVLATHLKTDNQRYIDLCIARLRQKIELDASRPQYIKTIRNKGYKLSRY